MTSKSHTKAEFDEFKHNLKIQITDSKIDVFTGDEIFMQWTNESIVKSELKYMLVTGGPGGGFGTWNVSAFKPYLYEIFIDNNLEYYVENSESQVWRNVRAEFANAFPLTSVGEFRNLQLSTTEQN